MKRQIRYEAWETNSSSTHSVSADRRKPLEYNYDALKKYINNESYDRKLHITFGEFGWERREYTDAYTKLQYALTMVLETEMRGNAKALLDKNVNPEKYFYSTEGFQAINDLIREKCDCDGVIIDDPGFELGDVYKCYDGSLRRYFDHNGYIDHQSCETYNDLKEFLNDYDINLEEFIFSENVELETSNDNG